MIINLFLLLIILYKCSFTFIGDCKSKPLILSLFRLIFWSHHTACRILVPSCCCSVAQSCPTLCNPINFRIPGLPVHHHLPEFAQTQIYWLSDAIQPSRPLSSPSPPAFYLSQHQGLFQWVSSLHQVAKLLVSASSVLPVNIQGWFPLGLTGLISLQSKGLSRVFSSTTVQKHQFFSAQLSLWSNSHIHTRLLVKP